MARAKTRGPHLDRIVPAGLTDADGSDPRAGDSREANSTEILPITSRKTQKKPFDCRISVELVRRRAVGDGCCARPGQGIAPATISSSDFGVSRWVAMAAPAATHTTRMAICCCGRNVSPSTNAPNSAAITGPKLVMIA